MVKQRTSKFGRTYEIDTGEEFPSVTTVLQCIGKPALINWAANEERKLVMKVAEDLYQDAPPSPKMDRLAWDTTMQARLGKEKAHQRLLSKAGDIGSQVHKLIDRQLRTELCMSIAEPMPPATDRAYQVFARWTDWRKMVALKPIYVEQAVWSRNLRVAGTMDLFAEMDGQQLYKLYRMEVPKTTIQVILDWKTGKAIYNEAHLQNAVYRHSLRELGHGDPKAGLIVRLPKTDADVECEVVPAMEETMCVQAFEHIRALWQWLEDREDAYRAAHKAVETPQVVEMSAPQSTPTEAPNSKQAYSEAGVPLADLSGAV